jgi:hypothetical protein
MSAEHRAKRALIHIRATFDNGPCRNIPSSFCVGSLGQRLGPNAGGGAKRGTGGCGPNDVVRLLMVAGTALADAGCWFGLSGS